MLGDSSSCSTASTTCTSTTFERRRFRREMSRTDWRFFADDDCERLLRRFKFEMDALDPKIGVKK